MTDHIVLRDGQPVQVSRAELDSRLEAAFKSAAWKALRELGLEPGSKIAGLDLTGDVADECVIARAKLSDGREASASAPIWPCETKAN